MLSAQAATPHVAQVGLLHAARERAAKSRITLSTASAGYVCGDGPAGALHAHSRPRLWLRLCPEDADPVTLLLSLVAGARRLTPGAVNLDQTTAVTGSLPRADLNLAGTERGKFTSIPTTSISFIPRICCSRMSPVRRGLSSSPGGQSFPALQQLVLKARAETGIARVPSTLIDPPKTRTLEGA